MALLKPPGLKPGDTIGFFSLQCGYRLGAKPLCPCRGVSGGQGFRLKAGSLTGQQDHWRSGSIAARADELNALIRDPAVRCIMSVIGGNNSNSLLPYLDFDALKRDPKIVIGYSDVTALLLGIHARTGLVTFYGPALVASFGELSPLVDETLAGFRQICQAGGGAVPHTLPTPAQWTEERLDWENQTRAKQCQPNRLISVGTGRVRGRLIGGNLNTMAGIWGSPICRPSSKGTFYCWRTASIWRRRWSARLPTSSCAGCLIASVPWCSANTSCSTVRAAGGGSSISCWR